jgi:ABC-type nitrate/sulfonate/bicarbonate transport system substrate-binding protein
LSYTKAWTDGLVAVPMAANVYRVAQTLKRSPFFRIFYKNGERDNEMKLKIIAGFLITALTVVMAVHATAFNKPEKTNLTYVEPGRYLIKLPVILAEAAGYFKEEGLNVDLRIAAGQRVYEALLAEDADFIAVSYGSMMKINQRGKKVHSVCNITKNCLFHFVAQPGIKPIEALKGKRIGVPKVSEEVTAVIRAALKRKGLDPDKDVNGCRSVSRPP